jgi:hypothetical protein
MNIGTPMGSGRIPSFQPDSAGQTSRSMGVDQDDNTGEHILG